MDQRRCARHWKLVHGDKTAAIEFLDEFRSNLFNEEVFVFTPKRRTESIASGATALDFAFDIHSEVGAHCMAAKVADTGSDQSCTEQWRSD